MGSKSIEDGGMGEDIGEAVGALLTSQSMRIFTVKINRMLLTKSSKTAPGDWLNTLESFVQCWEMLEIYCCVSHWK